MVAKCKQITFILACLASVNSIADENEGNYSFGFSQGISYINYVSDEPDFITLLDFLEGVDVNIQRDMDMEPMHNSMSFRYSIHDHSYSIELFDFDDISPRIQITEGDFDATIIGNLDMKAMSLIYRYSPIRLHEVLEETNVFFGTGFYYITGKYTLDSSATLSILGIKDRKSGSFNSILPSIMFGAKYEINEDSNIEFEYQRVGDIRLDKPRSHMNSLSIRLNINF